jgi:hypothetical protein
VVPGAGAASCGVGLATAVFPLPLPAGGWGMASEFFKMNDAEFKATVRKDFGFNA